MRGASFSCSHRGPASTVESACGPVYKRLGECALSPLSVSLLSTVPYLVLDRHSSSSSSDVIPALLQGTALESLCGNAMPLILNCRAAARHNT